MRRTQRYAWVGTGAGAIVIATALALILGGTPAGKEEPAEVAERPEPRGEACIHEDPERMRREHMDLLHSHRDESVRAGRHDETLSLQGCISCHATAQEQRAGNADDMAFCASCHEYAAVELDCFQCHSTDPEELPR
ncbi:MAG: sulfur reduction protein DsrJ [Halorhodospira sp.]